MACRHDVIIFNCGKCIYEIFAGLSPYSQDNHVTGEPSCHHSAPGQTWSHLTDVIEYEYLLKPSSSNSNVPFTVITSLG